MAFRKIKMIRVLVLGSRGMLGHQVMKALDNHGDLFEVLDVSHKEKFRDRSIVCDLMDKGASKELIEGIRPDVIVNCVGVLIGGSEDSERAIYLNSYLPHFLAGILNSYGGKLIHISTDCVFSGLEGGYTEQHISDGTGTYAITKSLGEVVSQSHLTLRTSIIGPELKENGEGLLNWFLQQTGRVQGYTDAIWSGVTTLVLAEVIVESILHDLSGLYQVTNNSTISKYDLLNLIKLSSKKEISIQPVAMKPLDKSLVDTRREISMAIPSYPEMVSEMICDIAANCEQYPHIVVRGSL